MGNRPSYKDHKNRAELRDLTVQVVVQQRDNSQKSMELVWIVVVVMVVVDAEVEEEENSQNN